MAAVLPPGQVTAKRFVIYAAFGIPKADIGRWKLKIDGLVEEPKSYSFSELQALPLKNYVKTFHCVTGWSRENVEWEGIPIKFLADQSRVRTEAKWVMFHCFDGYTAPVLAEDALHEDSIVAIRLNGRELEASQGYPARPFIPHLYGWKSAKWLDAITFLDGYRDGYWEMYGYHERGNVWDEERFKGMSGKHTQRRAFGTVS
jgi:DMSO/TMAO reductase YedYZ molybdopterin-dependent catalytic subunit